MDIDLTVAGMKVSRLKRRRNLYTLKEDLGPYWKITLTYGLNQEFPIDLWFASEADALPFNRPGKFQLSEMLDKLSPEGYRFTVDEITKEAYYGEKNRYTGRFEPKDYYRVLLSNEQLRRYVDLWYETEEQAIQWILGYAYSLPEMLFQFEIILEEEPAVPSPVPTPPRGTTTRIPLLIHDYPLNGDYNDVYGGPSLVPASGTLSDEGYSWSRSTTNQGLRLTGALANTGHYSIEMLMRFSSATLNHSGLAAPDTFDLSAMIEFSNRADPGYYSGDLNGRTIYGYNVGFFLFHVLITRNGTTKAMRSYVNGVLSEDAGWLNSFTDTANNYVAAGNVLHFFKDTLGTPDSTGFIVDASNTTPIVVTISQTGTDYLGALDTGHTLTITGVLGNTNANSTWTITKVIDEQHFELDGSAGNGAYGGGGTWTYKNINRVSSGFVDKIRIYSRPLSASEAALVYTGNGSFWEVKDGGAAGTYDGTFFAAGSFPIEGTWFGTYTE